MNTIIFIEAILNVLSSLSTNIKKGFSSDEDDQVKIGILRESRSDIALTWANVK